MSQIFELCKIHYMVQQILLPYNKLQNPIYPQLFVGKLIEKLRDQNFQVTNNGKERELKGLPLRYLFKPFKHLIKLKYNTSEGPKYVQSEDEIILQLSDLINYAAHRFSKHAKNYGIASLKKAESVIKMFEHFRVTIKALRNYQDHGREYLSMLTRDMEEWFNNMMGNDDKKDERQSFLGNQNPYAGYETVPAPLRELYSNNNVLDERFREILNTGRTLWEVIVDNGAKIIDKAAVTNSKDKRDTSHLSERPPEELPKVLQKILQERQNQNISEDELKYFYGVPLPERWNKDNIARRLGIDNSPLKGHLQ